MEKKKKKKKNNFDSRADADSVLEVFKRIKCQGGGVERIILILLAQRWAVRVFFFFFHVTYNIRRPRDFPKNANAHTTRSLASPNLEILDDKAIDHANVNDPFCATILVKGYYT